MSSFLKYWKSGFAAVLIVLGARATALAQNPTFSLEGVVSRRAAGGAAGRDRHDPEHLDRPDPRRRPPTTTAATSSRALPPEGRYGCRSRSAGFATEVRENLRFNAGQRAVLNFTLKLSTVQETVTVAGESPMVQTTSAEVTSTIDHTAFENLPVKERNYFRLLTLDSNVVAAGTGSNAVNVGGGEVWNFGTYVDGTNNHSKWLTLQRAPQLGSSGFAIETVKEVQLITNQFSAEFGGHSAGVASMITKSGTNEVNGSAFVMVRPGDWDATPPLAPIVNGEKVKAPYNQQQFGGTVGGPIVKDKVVLLRQLRAAPRAKPGGRHRPRGVRARRADAGRRAPGPRQGRPPLLREELARRALQHGALEEGQRERRPQPAGHRLHLGQQRRHRARHVPRPSSRPDAERSARPVLALYRSPRREMRLRVDSARRATRPSGGYDHGTWGVLPEETYDIVDTVSLWTGNHSMKTGASFTYDVTEQLYPAAAERRLHVSPARRPWRRTRSSSQQSFALVPEARLMFPKAYVIAGFFQDDWRVRNNLTLNLGLRYDVEIIKDIPDWPAGTDKNNLDPRVGFAWDPKGDQKWAVRGGFGGFTQQHPIFTIVKGGVGGRNGQVTLSLAADRSAVPDVPERAAGVPAGSGAAGAQHPGDLARPRERARVDGELGFQHQLGARTSVAVDANINRGVKHGFLDMNAPAPIPKDSSTRRSARIPNAIVRTQAQADATRPIVPGPNGFRHMDVLTNEGRSWYQGVRFAVQHRTAPLILDGVVHALEVRGSAEPLVLAGEQPRSRARSRSDRRRHAAQPRDQRHVEHPGSGPILERLAAERGDAQPERHAVHHPLCRRPVGYGAGVGAACNSRGCQPSTPGRPQHGARHVHQLRRPHDGASSSRSAPTASRSAPTCSTCSTTRTCSPAATSTWSATRGSGEHTGGADVLPGRQFQFARRIGSDHAKSRDVETFRRCSRSSLSVARLVSAAALRADAVAITGRASACRPSSATSSSRSIRRRRRARRRTS